MIMIDGEAAAARLFKLAQEYVRWNQKVRASIAKECYDIINTMVDEARKTEGGEVEQMMMSEKVCSLEPWFERGLTGRDVWRCGSCHEKIDKDDRFCKSCGRKLVMPRKEG